MDKTAKFSDQGKNQASSQQKAADFTKRAAQHAEQSYRGNKTHTDKKSISSQESISNPKESKIKSQRYRTSRLYARNLEVRQSLQQYRNAGQERRRLLVGGGGPEESSSQQQPDQEKLRQRSEETQDPNHPINRAADYLRGLTQAQYNQFNSHKHGFHNPEGEQIAKEHSQILNNNTWGQSSKNS